MTESQKNHADSHDVNQRLEKLSVRLKKLTSLQNKANKLSKKNNQIQKQHYRQSLLDFELAERQYFIEKSQLQPKFKLSATEVLTCEPDYVNDPEQASESSFLIERGVELDDRVLRLRMDASGNNDYMHPSMVFTVPESPAMNGSMHALNDYTYFVPLGPAKVNNGIDNLIVFFVYRDQTTLPVVHKYSLVKELNSALQRWQVSHVDTVFAKTNNALLALDTVDECEALFISRG